MAQTDPLPRLSGRALAGVARRMNNHWLWRVRFVVEDEQRRRAEEAGRRWDAAQAMEADSRAF